MRQTIIVNGQGFLISESASQRIESIIKEDIRQQEINYNFLNPEQETYSNKLSKNWRLPQEKSLLFSKDS